MRLLCLRGLCGVVFEGVGGVVFFVEYEDGNFLGWGGEDVSGSVWWTAGYFGSSEEANRWAAEKFRERLWRLVKVDIDADRVLARTEFVTPVQALFWVRSQEFRFPDSDVVGEPGSLLPKGGGGGGYDPSGDDFEELEGLLGDLEGGFRG